MPAIRSAVAWTGCLGELAVLVGHLHEHPMPRLLVLQARVGLQLRVGRGQCRIDPLLGEGRQLEHITKPQRRASSGTLHQFAFRATAEKQLKNEGTVNPTIARYVRPFEF